MLILLAPLALVLELPVSIIGVIVCLRPPGSFRILDQADSKLSVVSVLLTLTPRAKPGENTSRSDICRGQDEEEGP